MNLQVILPGSSAIPRLKEALTYAASGAAMMLPRMWSMDDFVNHYASRQRASAAKTLILLHRSFCRHHHSSESLEAFLPFGQQLLADFDLILRAGRQPEEVFAGMKQWDSAGAGFADFMLDEEKELMRNFSALFRDDLSERRARFLRLWENLPAVFAGLESHLKELGLGTPGIIYREAATEIRKLNQTGGQQFYFAGFSTLSRLESSFMQHLAAQGLADFAWDLLPRFQQKKEHEVKNVYERLATIPEFRPSLDRWKEKARDEGQPLVREIVCPGLSGMAQWILGSEFNVEKSTAFIFSDPAIIQLLAGSGKLSNGKNLRFSMGFPLAYTPMARWIFKLLRWCGRKNPGICDSFFPVMEDRYFTLFFPQAATLAPQQFGRSAIPELQHIRSLPGLPDWFFSTTATAFLPAFSGWMDNCLVKDNEDSLFQPSLEKMCHILAELRMELSEAGEELTFPLLQSFLNASFQGTALVSAAARSESFEAMGLFESRMLDFQRVIIAPAEDGLFPSAGPVQTMLPESVRRAFGLPLRQAQAEEQAWQFYRLCKRSEEVLFLVSSSADKRRSRFIDQIAYGGLFPFRKEGIRFGHHLYSPEPVVFMRNQEQMRRVREYTTSDITTSPDKKFSPTSLHALLSCPLRFHYQKIEELKEPESFSRTEMSPLDYGNWVHEGIQSLMKECGKDGHYFTREDYRNMENTWDEIAGDVWRKLKNKTSLGEIQDYPVELALGKIMAGRFFQFMATQPVHRWLYNEYDFPNLQTGRDGLWWKVSGRADLVLEGREFYYFLDLKTGAFQDKKKLWLKTDEEGNPDLSRMIASKDYFQMLLYNRLAAADPAFKGKKVLAGLFYLARPVSELAFPLEKVVAESGEEEFYQQFDDLLTSHVAGFSDESVAVVQTPDAANCLYCSFNAMCRRQVAG